MACQQNKPSKSILKAEQDQGPELGAYNIYAKRASFKDDVIFQQFIHDGNDTAVVTPPVIEARVPIAPDVTEQELSPEQIRKRDEFKKKRRLVDLEGTDGLDLKAVLAHRVSLTHHDEEEEEDDDDNDDHNEDRNDTNDKNDDNMNDDDEHKYSEKNAENDDSGWTTSERDSTMNKPETHDSNQPEQLTYAVPQIVNRLEQSDSSTNLTSL